MPWVSLPFHYHCDGIDTHLGKVGMSVLVKGLAMDFARQERPGMAITGIWPASVGVYGSVDYEASSNLMQ